MKKLNDYVNDVKEKINYWYESGGKLLNIQSLPYASQEIFLDLFKKEGIKILYITNENYNISIIDKLKSINFKDFLYYVQGNEFKKVNIVNYDNALNINIEFDLIIYDDLHCYPKDSGVDILNLILKLIKKNGRAISFSVECLFTVASNMVFPVGRFPYAFVEPQFIQTKVNLRQDICTFAYDFINWSIREKKKVIIYTPGFGRMYDVLRYLQNYYKDTNLLILDTNSNNKKPYSIAEFKRAKMAIIVTNDFDDNLFDYENKNIILLFADSKLLNHRQIINICGRVDVKDTNRRSEILLIGASQSKEVSKSLKITRELNRIAWESGCLII